jgi:thiamine pyrophosphate-dependent acetolactate synthase large subunit-like protein
LTADLSHVGSPLYTALSAELHRRGIDTVFGLMGDDNALLISHLVSTYGIRYFGARHEAATVGMADGYSRTTGEPGVCFLSQGPGLTNALTALVTASRGDGRVLAIVGDSAAGLGSHPKAIDQEALFGVAGVACHRLERNGGLVAALDSWMSSASPSGVSVLVIRSDVLNGTVATVDAPPDAAHRGTSERLPVTPHAAEADVTRLVAALLSAERPVILAGRGAHAAGAGDALRELGARSGALLATTLKAKGLFGSDPWCIGIAGRLGTSVAIELLDEADLVVAFGTSLDPFTTREPRGFPLASIWRVDVRGDDGRSSAVDRTIIGDAGEVARAAIALLDERHEENLSGNAYRNRSTAQRIASALDDKIDGARSPMLPTDLFRVLNQVLPASRTIVVDGGHACGWPSALLDVPDPLSFIWTLDFGSVGMGLGVALGAAIGRPDVLTVLVVGDGGLMMSLGDLETASRYRLRLLVVVVDDAAFGAEMHYLRMMGMDDSSAVFPDMDLGRVAASLGHLGRVVLTCDELPEVLHAVEADAHPTLLDCKVDRGVCAPWLFEKLDYELRAM